MKHQVLMWVLWPSFLAACVTSAAVFAFIDPLDISIFGYLKASRPQIYAAGFFLFWFMAALSSVFSLFLAPNKN